MRQARGVGRIPVMGITASLNPEPNAQVGVPVIGVRGPDIDAVRRAGGIAILIPRLSTFRISTGYWTGLTVWSSRVGQTLIPASTGRSRSTRRLNLRLKWTRSSCH